MRNLTTSELLEIAGGSPEDNINCTAGTSGVNCSGSLSDWGGAIADAYNWAVDAVADGMCAATGNC